MTPDAVPRLPSAPALVENGPTPYLPGIVGGVVGLFVGKWAMTRGCEENCAQQALLGGMVGILGGAALGYVIGGGEMVPPPPRRGRERTSTIARIILPPGHEISDPVRGLARRTFVWHRHWKQRPPSECDP